MDIEDAIKIVNSWPEWKKHLVENSMNPTCPTRGYGKRIESKTKMNDKEKDEIKKEVIKYIKDNLKIKINETFIPFNDDYISITVELQLENKTISQNDVSIKK